MSIPAFGSDAERSPLAKAAAGLPAAVGKLTRGFESLPSPPEFAVPSRASRERREREDSR
jgi:hypothetical protein